MSVGRWNFQPKFGNFGLFSGVNLLLVSGSVLKTCRKFLDSEAYPLEFCLQTVSGIEWTLVIGMVIVFVVICSPRKKRHPSKKIPEFSCCFLEQFVELLLLHLRLPDFVPRKCGENSIPITKKSRHWKQTWTLGYRVHKLGWYHKRNTPQKKGSITDPLKGSLNVFSKTCESAHCGAWVTIFLDSSSSTSLEKRQKVQENSLKHGSVGIGYLLLDLPFTSFYHNLKVTNPIHVSLF